MIILLKKKIILTCLALGLLSVTAAADELSEWSRWDFGSMSSAGILTRDVVSEKMKAPITRREACGLLYNVYESLGGAETPDRICTFVDTDDEYVRKAYAAGIVSGRTQSLFDPDSNVTREEFSKMIVNTLEAAGFDVDTYYDDAKDILKNYTDADDISEWAYTALAATAKQEIMYGTSADTISPKSNTTREQAVSVVSRVYHRFATEKVTYTTPEITSGTKFTTDNIRIKWNGTPDAKKYTVLIKDSNYDTVEEFETIANDVTVYGDDYENGVYTVIVGAESDSGMMTYSMPVDVTIERVTYTDYAPSNISRADKEAVVFPNGKPFETVEEAEMYMSSVTVPVWKVKSNGEKYSSTATLTVNSALADEVLQIFTEIYNSPEQFPIKSVGGYCWRNTAGGSVSEHSYGTCIDINPDENYYVKPDGTPITGSFWKPGENIYSMPADGSVVSTFKRYGWKWGGDAWGAGYSKDYMHMTYLGK